MEDEPKEGDEEAPPEEEEEGEEEATEGEGGGEEGGGDEDVEPPPPKPPRPPKPLDYKNKKMLYVAATVPSHVYMLNKQLDIKKVRVFLITSQPTMLRYVNIVSSYVYFPTSQS